LLFILVLLSVLTENNSYCQINLILNPSGEQNSYIPSNLAQYSGANDWWMINEDGSPDYFSVLSNSASLSYIPNNRFGYQFSHDGNFYFGITNFDWNLHTDPNLGSCFHCRAEYLAGQFISPLEKGKTYLFEFWMSKADSLKLISNALDLFIAYNKEVDVYDFENYANYGYTVWSEDEPFTEKVEWVKISTCFKAKGGERAFALGNFHDLTKIDLTYPYPDQVSVDYRYFDDFSMIECPTCCPEEFPIEDQLTVYSSPSLYGTPATLEMWLIPNSKGQLLIYDNAGRLIDNQDYSNLLNTYSFDGKTAGMYHYSFTTDLGYATYGKVLVGN
jgi:hypothetical protein